MSQSFATPYPDPSRVPKDRISLSAKSKRILKEGKAKPQSVLRATVEWIPEGEKFQLSGIYVEASGTPALLLRAKNVPKLGSFLAKLYDPKNPKVVFYDSVGTGTNYRKLARSLSFRFPEIKAELLRFELFGENPQSGRIEPVLVSDVREKDFRKESPVFHGNFKGITAKEIQKSSSKNPLELVIYAEGYLASEENEFFKDAMKIPAAFEKYQYPDRQRFNMTAVFAPSKLRLGAPKNLGFPIERRESFLGLYYPYWWDIGRWYHIVYPTDENYFRSNLALWPYDYPIVLVKSTSYWGVGNFKSHTAIPSGNASFAYLLLHEFGHFMGLNEEYEGGGPTELEFAPHIDEPWSQNISFLKETQNLKWKTLLDPRTPVPTPIKYWDSRSPVLGAYLGGYGESVGHEKSHIPGFACVMRSSSHFCDVCDKALIGLQKFDSGE